MKRGIPPKRIPSQELDKAITDYQLGVSQNETCRRLGINAHRFVQLMKERNVSIRGRFKHQVSSTYFDTIDTFYKAYFLGWLASDGSVTATRNSSQNHTNYARMGKICISIQERDGYILDKLKEELGFSGTIKTVDKGPGRQSQRRLSFCDQHMAQTLYRYGLTPVKSFSLGFPEIPDKWVPAFILGYFEGDGSVCWGDYSDKKRSYTAMRQRFDIIASVPFAEKLFSVLTERHGVKATKSLERRKSQPLIYVKGSSRDAVAKFYQLIYTNAPFWLKRKRDKFDEIFAQWRATS